MSGLGDITAAVGLGTTGVAVAGALYAGAAAINKEASATAKRDIAAFIKGFPPDVGISFVARHITHVLEIVFGPRHFSFRCIGRSLLATLLFIVIAFIVLYLKQREYLEEEIFENVSPADLQAMGRLKLPIEFFTVSAVCFVFSSIHDYLSLWKSRILLRRLGRSPSIWRTILFVPFDIWLSWIIYGACVVPVVLLAGFRVDKTFSELFVEGWGNVIYGFGIFIGGNGRPGHNDWAAPMLMTSTLMTSIWTFGVLVSSMLTKALMTLRYPLRILMWLYDVDKHAIKIVGLILAGITWLVFFVYGLI